MRADEKFDSFYLKTRRALVHQAFALTGDLPAAQRAVRDTYVAAWHHWRKVSAYDDPRDWVRPRAWALAHRRHTTRLWHRTKDVAPRDRAVLDALHRLSTHERRVLLLSELAGVPVDVAARELSMTQPAYEQELATTIDRFAELVGCAPDAVRHPLVALAGATGAVKLARPTRVRREGSRRRRTHTTVAIAAATVVAVGSGAVAHETSPDVEAGPAANPDSAASGLAEPSASTSPSAEPTGPALPSADHLLDARDVRRLVTGVRWRERTTHDNTSGEGINMVCQQDRFADPDGLSALVRTFTAPPRAGASAVQVVEISDDEQGARGAYETMASWFAGCLEDDVHLRRTHTVLGVGDRAFLSELAGRRGEQPAYSAAVAQVGQVVTATVTRVTDGPGPSTGRALRGLTRAADLVCEAQDLTGCVYRPRADEVAPAPTGEEPGILSTLDLPPLSGVQAPWAGTSPKPARPNPAATSCDRAQFARMGAERTRTRTFLVPDARLPDRFGLTESYGTFPGARAARDFLGQVRDRMAACEERELATQVLAPRSLSSGPLDGSTWRLETELSDDREIVFDVGFVRRGRTVAQVTFVPADRADLPAGAFRALVVRAGQRLRELD